MKILFVLILATALSACGTVAGLGDDIKGAATWTKNQMGGSDTKSPDTKPKSN